MNTRPPLVRLASASRTAVVTIVITVIAAGCAAPGASPSAAVATASPTLARPSAAPAQTNLQPPDALLSVGGGAPVVAALGTFTWLGTGSDGPWLRGTPVRLPPGGAATVSLQPPVATASWSVRKAKPDDTDGSTARQIASGTGPVAFTVPAQAGTILLTVDFAANAGTANYFWALSPG
jgi:hypothetical protein